MVSIAAALLAVPARARRRRVSARIGTKAGYKTTKPNTWLDAIACAEWLVANKPTRRLPKMSIMGGSAGGIFVGRAITDRPELFGAAVDQVPVDRDLMRAEFSANGVPNIPEFGTVKDRGRVQGLCSR